MGLFSFLKPKRSEDKKLFNSINTLTGLKPKNLALYRTAFTHKSVSEEFHNERLEYLGDSILSSVVSEHLFKKYPGENEGFLTRIRSRIVSREQLNKLGKNMGLDSFVEYRLNVNLKNSSILGNAVEALIGAIYIDLGYNKTVRFIEEKILQEEVDFEQLETTEINFKSLLLEWAQKEKRQLYYAVREINSDPNNPLYEATVFIDEEPYGKGTERSKKKAEQIAAEKTCKKYLYIGS